MQRTCHTFERRRSSSVRKFRYIRPLAYNYAYLRPSVFMLSDPAQSRAHYNAEVAAIEAEDCVHIVDSSCAK